MCRERNAESAIVKALGTAVVEGSREVVTVVLDLSGLPKGSYWLSTRHDDNDASDYVAMSLQ